MRGGVSQSPKNYDVIFALPPVKKAFIDRSLNDEPSRVSVGLNPPPPREPGYCSKSASPSLCDINIPNCTYPRLYHPPPPQYCGVLYTAVQYTTLLLCLALHTLNFPVSK